MTEKSEFEKLEQFKKWMQNDFREHCEKTYGMGMFANYIYPYYNDFLECVECHVEDLAEQFIQDEEINYHVR